MIGPINTETPTSPALFIVSEVTDYNWTFKKYIRPEFFIFFREKREESSIIYTLPGLYIYASGDNDRTD
jgi:hypothetical protein